MDISEERREIEKAYDKRKRRREREREYQNIEDPYFLPLSLHYALSYGLNAHYSVLKRATACVMDTTQSEKGRGKAIDCEKRDRRCVICLMSL